MSSRGTRHRDVPLAGAALVDLDFQAQLRLLFSTLVLDALYIGNGLVGVSKSLPVRHFVVVLVRLRHGKLLSKRKSG